MSHPLPHLISSCLFTFTAVVLSGAAKAPTPDSTSNGSMPVIADVGLSSNVGPQPDFVSDFQTVTNPAAIDERVISSTIYVDIAAPTGGDGSRAAPFNRIMPAGAEIVRRLESEPGVRLAIASGIYRENLSDFLRLKHDSDAVQNGVLVIEGAADGSTIISGSVLEHEGYSFQPEAWRPVRGEPGLYALPWPFAWTPDPGPWVRSFGHPEIIGATARREALIVDGEPMRLLAIEQWSWFKEEEAPGAHAGGTVLGGGRLAEGRMVYDGLQTQDFAAFLDEPGTFTVVTGVNAPEGTDGALFLRLPEDKTIDQIEQIEVPMLYQEDAPLIRIAWKNNLVLRNLTITHANGSYLSRALIVADSENVLIENCRIDYNTNGGLGLQRSHRVTLRQISASHNGQAGMSVGSTRQLLIEDCDTSYNNVRGQWTNFRRWDPAGIKLGDCHGVHLLRHTAVGNFAGGIWWDVYCTDMLVEQSLLFGNARLGVEMELSEPGGGNYEIRNSLAARNGATGVFISMAANTRVLNNILVNNGGEILESQNPNTQLCYKVREHNVKGPRSAEDWVSAVVKNNLMASQESARMVNFLTQRVDPAKQFPYVLRVLDANHNQYWSEAPSTAFVRPDLSFVGLEGWRALLAEYEAPGAREADSVWSEPDWSSNPADEFTSRSESGLTRLARSLGVPLDDAVIDTWFSKFEDGAYSNLDYR